MGDPFKKVRPGQKLEIPAEAYNAFIDAALAWKSSRFDRDASAQASRAGVSVLVRNISNIDCPRFGVLSFNAPIISPSDNFTEFASRITFQASPPTASNLDRFVIAQEPIAAGAIGRAIVAGVSIAKVNVTAESFIAARPAINTVANLVTWPVGATILWRESGTGYRWAIIDLSQRQNIVRFELTSALTPGGTASAKIRDANQTLNITITVTDALGIFFGSPPAHGVAMYMPDAGRYEILQLEC